MSAPWTGTEERQPPGGDLGTPPHAVEPVPGAGPAPGTGASPSPPGRPQARQPRGAARPQARPAPPLPPSLQGQDLLAGLVFPGTAGLRASEIFSGPGYQAPQPRTSPMAVAAFVCSLVFFVPGLGLVAIGLGWGALRRLRTTIATGESLAWFAVVVGSISSAAWLWLSVLLGISTAVV